MYRYNKGGRSWIWIQLLPLDFMFCTEDLLGIGYTSVGAEVRLSRVCSCSINSRHQLIQFKVMHRLHFSNDKLHQIFPVSPTCDRCKSAEGSLTHLFWTCPKLYEFWWFSDMYGFVVNPDPEANYATKERMSPSVLYFFIRP